MPTRRTAGNVYYAVGVVPGIRRSCPGNSLEDLRAGHRGEVEPDKRDPADFALWKAAGEGRSLKWPTARWGDGYPGLAPRVLGHGTPLPRRPVRPPHRRRSTTSSPTTRTRSPSRRRSSADRRRSIWVHGEHLLMAGRKMAKSAGNFQRVTELAERGHRPARVPLPRPDLALRPQAQLLGRLDRGGCGRPALRCGTRLAALGPPPSTGPWVGAAGARGRRGRRRPAGRGDWRAGFGGGRVRDRGSGTRAGGTAIGRRAALFTTGSSAALDDDLDLPARTRVRSRDPARRPSGRRAALARARCRRGARARPPSRLGGGTMMPGTSRRRSPRCFATATRLEPLATTRAPTRCAARSATPVSTSSTGPRGRPRVAARRAAQGRLAQRTFCSLSSRSRRDPNRSMIR